MPELKLFDSNCWLGQWYLPTFTPVDTVDRLVEEMDHYGIDEALVTHTAAYLYDQRIGNQALLDEISGQDRLHACFILVPPGTPELAPIDQYVDDMLAAGVRAARLFPKDHYFSLQEWSVGQLLAKLEKHRLPIIITLDQVSWDEVQALCQAHPKLPVIIDGAGRQELLENRQFIPLLQQVDNLKLDLHNFINYIGLDDAVEKCGADKFVFGTRLLFNTPAAAIYLLAQTDISEEDKQMIASGNLEKLIKEVRA